MNTVMPVDRRSRLRVATDVLHRRIDVHMDKAGFLNSIAGYRDYLARTLRVRSEIEQTLDASGASDIYPDWPRRRIASALADDLAELGGCAPFVRHAEDDRLGQGGVLGALYVLEGAAIGARLIERRVAALGAAADRAVQHLKTQTEDPKAFRAFLVVLEDAKLDPLQETQCIGAAVATFARFENAYTG